MRRCAGDINHHTAPLCLMPWFQPSVLPERAAEMRNSFRSTSDNDRKTAANHFQRSNTSQSNQRNIDIVPLTLYRGGIRDHLFASIKKLIFCLNKNTAFDFS